jgi:hypothetical protein
MAPDHKEISRKINQDLDDLKVRNPEQYRKIEEDYRRLQQKANFEVSMSPTHIRRSERLS